MGGPGRIRLLVVDDQPVVRRGLRMWLALQPDLDVVGEAGDGSDVCGLVDEVHPDVVLMDVEMPGLNGLDATAVVHAACPWLPVVILSMHDDIETRARAWVAGAAAFVAKAELKSELVSAIRDVTRHRQDGRPCG